MRTGAASWCGWSMSSAPRTLAELTGESFDAWIGYDELVWLRVDDGPLSVPDQVALGAFLAMTAGER
jgi:hypothetical protein